MKKTLLLLMFLAMTYVSFADAGEKTPEQDQKADRQRISALENATIGPTSVAIPIGKIILVRKGREYCAIRFTSTWLGGDDYDYYTAYEYYHQGDGSGDFNRSNVKFGDGELVYPRERNWYIIPFTTGAKDTFVCGGMKIKWVHKTGVNFDDFGLAPTAWKKITDVNVHDTRLKWFRGDINRKKVTVSVD